MGRPVREILALGEEIGAGLIVVGSRRLGPVKRAFLGGVPEGIVRRASCPVLVVRGAQDASSPTRAVVGVDFS